MKEPNRERKNDIKYKIQLNDEQKRAKAQVYNKDVSFFLGDFGSGKTQCAALCALDLLFKKHIDRIFITRPIDFSATGYLTGDINEKMAFHLFPIKQCFYSAYNKEKIDKLFADEVIKIIPIDYMKGVTFLNACTIVDEFEDINYADFKVILSRLGINSKIIFTGSEEQIAIKDSCIPKIKCLKNYEGVNYQIFTSQHRNENIQLIFDYIKENS